MKKTTTALAVAAALLLTGCSTAADVGRRNLDTAAEEFEIERRITFVNGINHQPILEVVGRCSYEVEELQHVVVCLSGPGEEGMLKHSMSRSDNSFMVNEQLGYADVDTYNYRYEFKPENLIPDVDFQTSTDIEGDG